MRDNLHEDLFADHAWQEMHKVLDREMPERKRRGAFWLWFLPALGLCVLLGRDTLLEGKIPVAEEKPQHEQPAIAQVKKHTVQNADKHNKTKPQEPTATKTEAIAALETVRRTGNSQKNGNANLSAQKEIPQGFPVLVTLPPSASEQVKNNNQASINSPSNQGEKVERNINPGGEDSALTSIDKTVVERWSSSQLLDMRQSDLDLPLKEQEKAAIKTQRARQKLEWWTEAGTQFASEVNGLSGFKAGILTGIPIGQMRIQTGLNYEMTEVGIQSIQRDLITGQANVSGIKLADAGRTSTSISVGQNNGEPVSSIQLQLVNFNLSLYHPIGKRFGVALGGNLHYLGGIKLGNQYLRSTLFDKVENSVQFSTTVGNSLLYQSSNLSKNSFSSFGFSAQGLVSYRLATRWNAYLGYRQSLQHFTKTNDLLLKPSWVDLGVRFRLK